MTDRRGLDYENSVAGFDGILKITQKDQVRFQFLGSQTRYPDEFAAENDQKAGQLTGSALQAYYEHNTRNFNVYGAYGQTSPDFRADLGFMSRAAFSYSELGGSYKWQRDPGHWFTWLSLYVSHDLRLSWDKEVLHRAYTGRMNYMDPLQSFAGLYGEIGQNHYNGESFRMNYIRYWFGLQPSGWFGLEFFGYYGRGQNHSLTQLNRTFFAKLGYAWRP